MDDIAVAPNPKTMDALDLRVLAQLAAIQRNGRPGFVECVITLFLQTASNLIKDLEAASANNESDTLYRASHTLKPCSATVGALSLAALCETLEGIARSAASATSMRAVADFGKPARYADAAASCSFQIAAIGYPGATGRAYRFAWAVCPSQPRRISVSR